jgi:hypothetical protein
VIINRQTRGSVRGHVVGIPDFGMLCWYDWPAGGICRARAW